MWTYIENENIEEYINTHPKLEEFWNLYSLANNEQITFLPRYFNINFPSKHLINYAGQKKGHVEYLEDAKLKKNLKLRPKQQEAFDTVSKLYESNKFVNGILKLPTGSGKTVLAIYMAIKFKIKTAIIVNNKKLLKQWITAILEYTNLTEQDIGLIAQQIVSYKNKKIIMCMSQTLSSKMKSSISKIFNNVDAAGIGLVFFDEVHTASAAELNAKVSLLFRTKNVIGLSATPFHITYQDILMKNTIGNIIFESNEYPVVPNCYIQYFDSKLTKYKYIYKISDFIKQRAMYNKFIVNSESYFDSIIDVVNQMRANNEDPQILIIAMTLNQIDLISGKLTEHNLDHEILTGAHSEISETCNIIVGTYKFCNAGLDIPRLNCLLLATPLSGKKSYLQTSGRILRSYATKNKATVVSLFDSCFMNMFIPDIERIRRIIATEHSIELQFDYLQNSVKLQE